MLNRYSFICMLTALLAVAQLSVVEPMHHHADNMEHGDCAVCMSATMPLDTVMNFELSMTETMLTEEIRFFSYKIINSDIHSNKSRSPPFCMFI